MKPKSTNVDNALCATDKTWELKIALHGQTEYGYPFTEILFSNKKE